MPSRKYLTIAGVFVCLLGLGAVNRAKSDCLPVYEVSVTNVTSNATHVLNYPLPKCPQKYAVGRIIVAELRAVSSSGTKNFLDITEILSSSLNSCRDKTSCVLDIPLKSLVNSSANGIEIAVNYTCQANSTFLLESNTPNSSISTITTNSVTYTLTEMTSIGQDWTCTISSSAETAFIWRWLSANSNFNQTVECSGGNGNNISTVDQNVASDICMKAQSVIMIKFLVNVFEVTVGNILLDIQEPRGSDLEIQCTPVAPAIFNPFDLIKANCSDLHWTTSSSKKTSPNPSTSASELAIGRDTNTSPLTSNTRISVQGLALGLGLGLGLLIVLIALVLAVVCLKRSRGKKRETSAKKTVEDADDGGFVPANDVFTCKNFKATADNRVEPGNPYDLHLDDSTESRNSTQSSSSPIISSPSPPAPSRPSSSEAAPGNRTKKCRTLTKKVFTQIAETAKQEERNGKDRRKSSSPNTKSGSQEPDPDPDASYVDVWLYSSTLDGIHSPGNTVNRSNQGDCIHIPRRYEIDL